MMKTEVLGTIEPIWTSSDELLTTTANETTLPVIGSCQVSSIFQNLDTNENAEVQNMDLIIIHTNDPNALPLSIQGNYIVLKDGVNQNEAKDNNFEDMLYYVCNLCPFLCTQDSKITEHLYSVHKNKSADNLFKLKCPACANIFYHKQSLKSHLTYDHKVSTSDLNLIMQAVTYYAQNKNECKAENKEESNKNNVDENVTENENNEDDSSDANDIVEPETEKDEQQVINNKINLPQVDILLQSSNFNNLMKKNEANLRYVNTKKCPKLHCKVRMRDASRLAYHVKCHSILYTFECPECKEIFATWRPSLVSHLWREHKIDMELYSCDKCDYKSHSLSKLNTVHKLIHSDVKAFSCDVCQKAFKNNKQLRNHKVWHTDKVQSKSATCSFCSKKFTNKRSCNIHIDVVHKKLRQHLCSYCGYKGSSKASLQMHTRTHTGEKPFLCSECSYSTSDHNSLRRHKLRHSGEKPYKCVYCPYSCIQSTTYKVHMRTKHPGLEKGLMFTCQNCQYRTVNKAMYVSHMETIHKETVDEKL